jgi:hypothetical protein
MVWRVGRRTGDDETFCAKCLTRRDPYSTKTICYVDTPSAETPVPDARTWGMKTPTPRPEPARPVRTLPPYYADTSSFRGWGPRVPGL